MLKSKLKKLLPVPIACLRRYGISEQDRRKLREFDNAFFQFVTELFESHFNLKMNGRQRFDVPDVELIFVFVRSIEKRFCPFLSPRARQSDDGE